MKTLRQIREYLAREKALSAAGRGPEWRLFQSLEGLAERCQSSEEFCRRAQDLRFAGSKAEEAEARAWLAIVLDEVSR